MVTGVLLSTLARQFQALGTAFGPRYPHPWLLWEPGSRVSAAAPQAVPVTTVVPLTARPKTPGVADPVCFPLVVATPGSPVRVGRAPTNEIVIDDLTVSREHFELWLDSEGWSITVRSESTATTLVRSMSLQPGEKLRLVDGCAIVAGGAQLTFVAQGRLLPRLIAANERLKG
ncbi:MAG: FHA domain-containing protein [Myxococcaceae bacterium]|nr:FHA domain-containing protein [Myxococcaceae bacterium]